MKVETKQHRRIIGVMLVRNEDLHVAWALANILDFCDRVMVLDNYSTDRTWRVVAEMAKRHPKIELRRWWNAKTSQKALRKFYRTPSWIFRVDGDEIHDPGALAKVRRRKQRIKPNPSGNPHNARPGPGNTVEYKMKRYASGEILRKGIGAFIK